MRFVIQNQEYFFENKEQAVAQIQQLIEQTLSESQMLFSHMTVNGTEVYQDPFPFLKENLDAIDHVVVHLVTAEEYLEDVCRSAYEYASRAIPQVSSLSDEFYTSPDETSWNKLSQLAEALQWFQQMESFLGGKHAYPQWIDRVRENLSFSEVLRQLDEAVQAQDLTLIGDILQYEVVPRFERLERAVADLFKERGM